MLLTVMMMILEFGRRRSVQPGVADDDDGVVRRAVQGAGLGFWFIVVKTSLLRPLNGDLLSFAQRLAFFGRD